MAETKIVGNRLESPLNIGAGTSLQLPNGSETTPALTFSSNTNTGIYTFGSNSLAITCNGVRRFSVDPANGTVSTVNAYFPFGSALQPAISIVGDENTGLYRVGADNLGISTNGILRFDVGTAAVTSTLPWRGQDGSAALPGISFSNDSDTGIYRSFTNSVGFVAGGVIAAHYNSTQFYTDVQFLATAGTAAAPSISPFDLNSGMYSVAADQIGISTNGTLRFDVSTTAVTSTLPVIHPVGSAAAPSITFTGDTNTGMYWINADNIGFAANGALRFNITDNQVRSTGPMLTADGTVTAPGFTFGNDTDTGIYRSAANFINFATGGTLRLALRDDGVILAYNQVSPSSDNAFTLGSVTNRWSAVWAANGTIQTSHSSFKEDISDIEDIEVPKGIFYRWKDNPDRLNIGFLADNLPKEAYEWDENGQILLGGVRETAVVGILCAAVRKLQLEVKVLKGE